MLYRVKQFFWGITADISVDDVKLIGEYLDEYERKIFLKLPKYEQAHSIKVGKRVIEENHEHGLNDISLIKAAFLHDIGKINGGLNLITKSIMVLGERFAPNIIRRCIRLKMVNTYFNHPELAITYLKTEDERLKYLILNHHKPVFYNDKGLKILQDADSDN